MKGKKVKHENVKNGYFVWSGEKMDNLNFFPFYSAMISTFFFFNESKVLYAGENAIN